MVSAGGQCHADLLDEEQAHASGALIINSRNDCGVQFVEDYYLGGSVLFEESTLQMYVLA